VARDYDAEAAKTIAIDFDGVLHAQTDWNGGYVEGDLIPGSAEAIKALSGEYRLVLYTCKARSDRPLVDGTTGTELVSAWLDSHGLLQYIDEITAEKPRACYYIDDKAVRFTNWFDTLSHIQPLKWTEGQGWSLR